MKTQNKLLAFFFLMALHPVFSQDQPVSCTNAVTAFNEVRKGQITSQIRNAHQYYMYSSDPAAGNTYPERMANLNNVIKQIFQEFMKVRRSEYRATICKYHGIDWNRAGNSSWRTLTCQPGFYLLQETLERTTNGDWKGGPIWTENSIRWKTGGHRSSRTFVNIDAKYKEDYIAKVVVDELNIARKELNDLGIPTEVPAFLD